MFLEGLAYFVAKFIIVLYCLDFSNPAQTFEGLVVELVDLADVWISHNNIWQSLHVSNSMRQAADC